MIHIEESTVIMPLASYDALKEKANKEHKSTVYIVDSMFSKSVVRTDEDAVAALAEEIKELQKKLDESELKLRELSGERLFKKSDLVSFAKYAKSLFSSWNTETALKAWLLKD